MGRGLDLPWDGREVGEIVLDGGTYFWQLEEGAVDVLFGRVELLGGALDVVAEGDSPVVWFAYGRVEGEWVIGCGWGHAIIAT